MHGSGLFGFDISFDDFARAGLVICTIAAAVSLSTGIWAWRKRAVPEAMVVRLPDGTVLHVSKSMGQAELDANLRKIQVGLASLGGGQAAPLKAKQPGKTLQQAGAES